MNYCILGSLEVVADDGHPVIIPGIQERRLLAALLIGHRQVVSIDRLVDVLWGEEPPGNPRNALQVRVSRLRKALPDPSVIVTTPRGYQLDATPEEVDAQRFEQLIAEARSLGAQEPARAISRYEDALSLWRGAALSDFATEEFARAETTRLEEIRLAATEERIDLILQDGRHGEVIGELESLVTGHPFREHVWAQLMLALYKTGRQADALAAFHRVRDLLREELGLEPSAELRELHQEILTQDTSLDSASRTPAPPAHSDRVYRAPARHNLPPRMTSLIGRQSDVAAVQRLLGTHRLATIVGTGGVGKTSLAIAVATEELDNHPDGVWLVELAPLTDSTLLPAEVARVLNLQISGRPTQEVLIDVLRERELLLVVDNCEHLINDCAHLIALLLRHAPAVQVLATSREPLKVPGESQYALAPLQSPSAEEADADVETFPSVRLFLDRARSVMPELSLDAASVPAVAQICRRLDGLPLAIELAAARIRSVPPQEMATRLEHRMDLLASGARVAHPRQQTLAGTLDWSYDLLTADQRRAFERFAVFAGDCSLEAADAITGDGLALVDLVDRSLVTATHRDGSARYEMLETIQKYALGRLQAAGELPVIARRHAIWFRDFAERAQLQGPDLHRWVTVLAGELGNVRAAVDYAIHYGDIETALQLCAAMGWFWFHGNRNEGRRILDRVIELASSQVTGARVDALLARAMLDMFGSTPNALAAAKEALRVADLLDDRRRGATARALVALDGVYGPHSDESLRLLGEAEEGFRSLEDGEWGRGLVWFQRMEVLAHRGDLRAGIEAGQRALDWFRPTDDPWAVSAALAHLARLARFTGRLGWGADISAEALAISRHQELVHTVQFVLTQQGYLAFLAGDYQGAEHRFREALDLASSVGNRVGVADIANGQGESALQLGAYATARQLHWAALEEYLRLGLDTGIASTLSKLGLVEEAVDNVEEAQRYHRDALEAAARVGDTLHAVPSVEGLGRVMAAGGDHARAAELLHLAARLRQDGGLWRTPAEQRALSARLRALGDALAAAITGRSDARTYDLDATGMFQRVDAILH